MVKAFIALPDRAQIALIELAEAFAKSQDDGEGAGTDPHAKSTRGKRQ
jgi:hypothetical protein